MSPSLCARRSSASTSTEPMPSLRRVDATTSERNKPTSPCRSTATAPTSWLATAATRKFSIDAGVKSRVGSAARASMATTASNSDACAARTDTAVLRTALYLPAAGCCFDFRCALARGSAGTRAASGLRLERFTRLAVDGHRAERVERLPGDTGRILHPILVRTGVAAGNVPFSRGVYVGALQLVIEAVQFRIAIGLQAKMIDAHAGAPGRDGEVDARILEHPFCVVRLGHGRVGPEQRRIEANALLEIAD